MDLLKTMTGDVLHLVDQRDGMALCGGWNWRALTYYLVKGDRATCKNCLKIKK